MLKLQKGGKKVVYFKPIGIPKGAFSCKSDKDIGFIQKTFKTELPYDVLSPVSIPDCYYIDLIDAERKQEYLDAIVKSYNTISEEADYIVIEGGPSIKKFIRIGVDDVTIAQALGINELIFVEKESSDKCIDDLFFTKKYFEFRGVKIKGVLFNKIDFDYIARIKELEENHIKRYDIPILGIVQKSLALLSARVSEIQSAIGGEFINQPAAEGLNNLVDMYLIGAMNPMSALKYLRQVKRAAFITGGDRSDLILAALNESISVLILTGYIQPDISVISAANKKKIPILLSPSDTYTTIRNMERVKPGIQEDEIGQVLELMEKDINWDLLLE